VEVFHYPAVLEVGTGKIILVGSFCPFAPGDVIRMFQSSVTKGQLINPSEIKQISHI
jgi:hypothetical protein